MSRFKAFGIHLALSFAIFLFLAYFVIFEWYPDFFFETDGGWRGLRIIAAVDMVLGPALTLVVYKTGKPGLRTDLALIGLFQFACLSAGTYVVWSERPITVVFNDGRFTAMTIDDYDAADQDVPNLSRFPGENPKWVIVDVPKGNEEEADFRSEIMKKGVTVATAVDFYVPFNATLIQEQSLDLEIIRAKEGGDEALANWVKTNGGKLEDYRFFTISTRYTYAYMGFRLGEQAPIGLLPINAL